MMTAPFDRDLIPHKPGIYIYKDSKGKILYVGKAVDLYSRVSSYFSGRASDSKTLHLVNKIQSLETIVVESELEALILEANLIKKHLPLYNIKLTDDKDYLYIVVTKEDYPRIITGRKQDLKTVKKYFGPFPSAKTVKVTLKQLRRIFPWCSNPPRKSQESRIKSLGKQNTRLQTLDPSPSKSRPCFYYHLKLCPGACVGAITKDDYNQIIKLFTKFMDGKKVELIEELTLKMNNLSLNQQYEQAQIIKKMIFGISYITQPTRIHQYLENPNFLEDFNQKSLIALQTDLKLEGLPNRIECFDISNIQGQYATGSMVVLTNGDIDKSQYRRFKIKITGKANDYAMHAEMMGRRLNHKEWPQADLILIDGGRGQVRAALKELEKKGLKIPMYGLAKRLEWLYPPQGEVIKLPKRSLSIRLLQKIRDEAHRFAINYHRKLRDRSTLNPQIV